MKTGKVVLAIAALLPFAALTTEGAVVEPTANLTSAAGRSIDSAIDAIVAQRVAADKLSSADALVLREQLQLLFQSLSSGEQAKVLAAAQSGAIEEGAMSVMYALNAAVAARAQQAIAESAPARAPNSVSGPQAKFGPAGPDLTFYGTAGPCRVFDSRNGPGMLAAASARQVWVSSNGPGYSWATDQGGIGSAGAGNCVGTVFNYTTNIPKYVVAIVTVVNTTASGALQAWNGGTVLSAGAVLNWIAGERLTNTTVIPMDRFISPLGGSGSKRDIGINNNSGAAIDFVIDVLGYFMENQSVALDCINNTNTSSTSSAVDVLMTASACPAGYTATGISCASSAVGGDFVKVIKSYIQPLAGGPPTVGTCRFENTGGASQQYWAYLTCCRVPGN